MDIYIFLFILLLLLSFFKKNILIYWAIYIGLLIISGFRNLEVGTDTANYYRIYKVLTEDPNGLGYIRSFIEPGWICINYISGFIWGDYRYVILIGTFLTLTPLFVRVWKSTKKPILVIFYYVALYFYFYSFNITRQMIAISIIIFSFYYLKRNKIRKYFIGVICAMLFHYSAIFCLTHPWIIKNVNISTIKASFILGITYILGLYVIPIIIPLIPMVGHYSAYIVDAESSGSITRILLNVFFIFICISCNNKEVKSYLALFFIGIVIYNLFAYSSVVGRLALYFTFTQLFLFPELDSKFMFNKYILHILSILYVSTYYFLMLFGNTGEIIPYGIGEKF